MRQQPSDCICSEATGAMNRYFPAHSPCLSVCSTINSLFPFVESHWADREGKPDREFQTLPQFGDGQRLPGPEGDVGILCDMEDWVTEVGQNTEGNTGTRYVKNMHWTQRHIEINSFDYISSVLMTALFYLNRSWSTGIHEHRPRVIWVTHSTDRWVMKCTVQTTSQMLFCDLAKPGNQNSPLVIHWSLDSSNNSKNLSLQPEYSTLYFSTNPAVGSAEAFTPGPNTLGISTHPRQAADILYDPVQVTFLYSDLSSSKPLFLCNSSYTQFCSLMFFTFCNSASDFHRVCLAFPFHPLLHLQHRSPAVRYRPSPFFLLFIYLGKKENTLVSFLILLTISLHFLHIHVYLGASIT